MTILGISGSPRRHGNTELLLDKVLEGARSKGAAAEKIVLSQLDFKACQDCGGCGKTGACVLTDDMRLVYQKVAAADYIVIASPIFFGTITSQLKAMIDRFQPLWIKKYILKKTNPAKKQKAFFLCVSGADKKEFFANAKYIIKIYFNTINAEYAGDIYCGGVEGRRAIVKKKNILDKAFRLGVKIASGRKVSPQMAASTKRWLKC